MIIISVKDRTELYFDHFMNHPAFMEAGIVVYRSRGFIPDNDIIFEGCQQAAKIDFKKNIKTIFYGAKSST